MTMATPCPYRSRTIVAVSRLPLEKQDPSAPTDSHTALAWPKLPIQRIRAVLRILRPLTVFSFPDTASQFLQFPALTSVFGGVGGEQWIPLSHNRM